MEDRSATIARAERIQERLSRALPPDHPILMAGLSADLACLYEIAGRTIDAIDRIDGNVEGDPGIAQAGVKQIAEEWLLKASFYIDAMNKHLRPFLDVGAADEPVVLQGELP